MSRQTRPRRGDRELPPPDSTIQKLEKMVESGNYYEAQQMYKSTSARYIAARQFFEALEILQSGALVQLKHNQVTCGAELAVMFVDALVKGGFSCYEGVLEINRIKMIYEAFPRIPLQLDLEEDEAMQKFTEAMVAAKARVESCSSFLKAAIKWSAEFGESKNGSPELHDMLAEYMYSESPESDMTKVSSHFVRGKNPQKFASTLVNFMGKCYPGEDDVAIARAVLMYLSQGNLRDANKLMDELKIQLESNQMEYPQSDLIQFIEYLLQTLERDAFPLVKILRQKYKSSIERDPLFAELLDEIAERFYGVKRKSGIQGLLGDLFKMQMG